GRRRGRRCRRVRTRRTNLGGAEVGNARSFPWRCGRRRIGREGRGVLACVGVVLGGEDGHVADFLGLGRDRPGWRHRTAMGALEASTSTWPSHCDAAHRIRVAAGTCRTLLSCAVTGGLLPEARPGTART